MLQVLTVSNVLLKCEEPCCLMLCCYNILTALLLQRPLVKILIVTMGWGWDIGRSQIKAHFM